MEQNTDKTPLELLLEAIDYSFLNIDGTYDKSLTMPVIDKVKWIKRLIKDARAKEQKKIKGSNGNAMKEWWDENMSHGAFALTQDELDFYYKPKE